jgi:hypothetical protein
MPPTINMDHVHKRIDPLRGGGKCEPTINSSSLDFRPVRNTGRASLSVGIPVFTADQAGIDNGRGG